MTITASDVINKKFEKGGMFGYKTEDVDAYMSAVAEQLAQLTEENASLERKLEVLADKLEEYRKDEDSLRNALVGAQRLGDSVVKEARSKAELIMRDATIKSETMIGNAQNKVHAEEERLVRIRDEISSFKNDLISLCANHVRALSTIPDEVEQLQKKNITEPGLVSKMKGESNEPEAEPSEAKEAPSAEPVAPAPEAAPAPEVKPAAPADPGEIPAFQANAPAPQSNSKFGQLKFGENYNIRGEK